ncbi:MAG: putative membrane protein YecN with MAPEG domain [Cellvibrionaceae bacterium]|jgi:uncharacterized membrane protein YecN with MAPEG domain
MITGFYAAILAILFFWLTLKVVKLRRKNKIGFGDGGIEALQQAISAHNNMAQYSPIILLLLFFLEYQQLHYGLIHISAILFIVGRWIHYKGMTQPNLKQRVLGMQLTLFPMLGLAALNLLWPVYRFMMF